MNFPPFLSVDGSSFEEEAHPVAIAWSLPDGRIKTTLVQPDDGWDDWDYALEDIHGISQDTLYQRGETSWSVVRELENDLEQSQLLTEDVDRIVPLMEKLYEACSRELTLDCQDVLSELPRSEQPELVDALFHQQLPCDERVLLMLKAWAAANGEDADQLHLDDSDPDW